MNTKADTIHATRLLKALTLTLATLLVTPGVEAILKTTGLSDSGEVAYAGLDTGVLSSSNDPFAALDAIEQQIDSGTQVPPEGYEEEVGIPPGARDLRVSDERSVVSFVVDCDQEEAFSQVESSLGGKGWKAIPLGGVCGATFTKNGGAYPWMLATCTQTGAATTVVMRLWR